MTGRMTEGDKVLLSDRRCHIIPKGVKIQKVGPLKMAVQNESHPCPGRALDLIIDQTESTHRPGGYA